MRLLHSFVIILTLLASCPSAKSTEFSKATCLKNTIKEKLSNAFNFRGENHLIKKAFAVSVGAHVGAAAWIAHQSSADKQHEVDHSPFKMIRPDSAQDLRLITITREQLKKEARQGLKDWSNHKPLSVDLGPFIIAAEGGGKSELRSYQSLKERVLEMAKTLKKPTTPEDLLQIRKYLTESVTGNYCLNQILMIDYFNQGCGNCQSHTKMMVAILSLKELGLDPRFQIGLQTFSDHLEPVFVDTKSGSILPASGDHWTTTYRAPVYAPAMIYAAYLDGARESIPSNQLAALKLPRPPGVALSLTQSPKLIRWISPPLFSWDVVPHGTRAMDGSPPKYSSRTFGQSLSYQLLKGLSPEDQDASQAGPHWTVHLFRPENQEIYKQFSRPEYDDKASISVHHNKIEWKVGNPQIAERILKLKSQGECQRPFECTNIASREFIARELQSKEIAQLQSIWKDPANLERYSSAELNAMIEKFQDINALRKRGSDAMFAELDASIREYIKTVQKDSLGLIQKIDKLPSDKKEKFFLLNRQLTYKDSHDLGLIPPWSDAFLSDFASGKIVAGPILTPPSQERIQVRLMTAPNSPVHIAMGKTVTSSANSKTTPKRTNPPQTSDKKVTLQADTWMFLALSLVNPDALNAQYNNLGYNLRNAWNEGKLQASKSNMILVEQLTHVEDQLATGWNNDVSTLFLQQHNLDHWKYQALGIAALKSKLNQVHPENPRIAIHDSELEQSQFGEVSLKTGYSTSESDRKFIEGTARAVFGDKVKVETKPASTSSPASFPSGTPPLPITNPNGFLSDPIKNNWVQ
jgi:hypothetical protein